MVGIYVWLFVVALWLQRAVSVTHNSHSFLYMIRTCTTGSPASTTGTGSEDGPWIVCGWWVSFYHITYEDCGCKGSYCCCMACGGACVDVHAADMVIDSDCLAWSPTCRKCCCKELTISLSLQVAQTILCSSEYMSVEKLHAKQRQSLKDWGLTKTQ